MAKIPSGGPLNPRDGNSVASPSKRKPNPTVGIGEANLSYTRPGKGDSYKKSGSAYKNG